jgi:hypothetical protein
MGEFIFGFYVLFDASFICGELGVILLKLKCECKKS